MSNHVTVQGDSAIIFGRDFTWSTAVFCKSIPAGSLFATAPGRFKDLAALCGVLEHYRLFFLLPSA